MMKKIVVLLIVVTITGLVGWQIYLRIPDPNKPTTRQRRAISVPVEAKPIHKTIVRDLGLFTGTLHPRSQFIVAPKISGRLEKLLVEIGDHVKRDQLIAVLEDDEYIQQVDQARAELEVTKANVEESRSALEIAHREFERVKALRQKKIVSESALDTAQAEFKAREAKHKVALAQVAQKKAALKAVRVRLSYTQIRASWQDGDQGRIVGERFVDEGTMLSPNASIVSILDIDFLTAVIFVVERDYSKVRIGQEGTISTDAFPGRAFSGRVVRVAPILKETSREARVEMDVPNLKGLLKPGMFIRVQMEFARKENATVVPFQALVRRNGKEGVFVADLKEMKAHFVPVTLGIVNRDWAEVVNPSLSGSVVTLGQNLLEEGSTIILPGSKPVAQSPVSDGEKKAKRDSRSGGK